MAYHERRMSSGLFGAGGKNFVFCAHCDQCRRGRLGAKAYSQYDRDRAVTAQVEELGR